MSTLEAHGIDRVFGIPGGPISPFVDATLDSAVELVACQHETMATYAASGYARATGRVGVVCVTSGPGALSALTGLAAARLDELPLLLLVGEPATTSRGRAPVQDGSEHGLDLGSVTASLAKRTVLVERSWSIPMQISAALDMAKRRPAGPVVVRLPVDVARAACRPCSVDLVSAPEAAEIPPGIGAEIARAIRQAKRPAILLGGRAYRSGVAGVVRRLAERTACPVATDLEAKGLFPETHQLSLGVFGVGGTGRAESYFASGLDFLLVVGARLDDTMTGGFSESLRPAAGRVFQLDFAPDWLGRSYAFDRLICADIGRVLEAAFVESTPCLTSAEPLTPLRAERTRDLGAAPHDPRLVPAILQRLLPKDTVFVADIGNHLLFAAQGMVFDEPGRFHASLGLGGMGSGMGTAIGMALGLPDVQVVSICGDGGLLMYGGEIATCAKLGLNLVFAVFNDGQWGMVEHGSQRVYGRSHDWRLPPTDITGYARALGAAAVRVETHADLSILQHGWQQRRPLVLDIPVAATVHAENPRDATLNFKSS
ncbi:MAG: thiamine pyrophosphate-binding protein [Polyangiaceae bacterium]|nr:thiamine pyrophosphate-binding protein [Polyangiaceae bacterium]